MAPRRPANPRGVDSAPPRSPRSKARSPTSRHAASIHPSRPASDSRRRRRAERTPHGTQARAQAPATIPPAPASRPNTPDPAFGPTAPGAAEAEADGLAPPLGVGRSEGRTCSSGPGSGTSGSAPGSVAPRPGVGS